jgi:predicted Zn-dependent peptidase
MCIFRVMKNETKKVIETAQSFKSTEQRTRICEGLDVVSEHLPWAGSSVVGIWLEAGSRDELPHENGLAHLYEHMVFKGSENRSALDLVYELESKGGYLNAFTSRENTCFYARVMADEFDTATEIVCDLVANPKFDAEDFEKEKEVVLEEVRSVDDSPDEAIHELYSEALWGDTGLGRPIAGTVESVEGLTLESLKNWQDKVLNSHRMVVSAAGQVDHEHLVKLVKKFLAKKINGEAKPKEDLDLKLSSSHSVKDLQQTWYTAGTSVKGGSFKERVAWNLFNALFGEGMASRLFQNIREKYGLVYSIYSSVDLYRDQNGFNVSMCADPAKLDEAIGHLTTEIAEIIKNGISQKELEFARQMVKGSLLLGMESVSSRMNRVARLVMYDMPPTPLEDVVTMIESIQLEDVQEVIAQVFQKENWVASWMGPKAKSEAPIPFK